MRKMKTLTKVLVTLGIGYVVYRLMQKVVEKLTKEEEESSNVGKKSDKGSSTKKRE